MPTTRKQTPAQARKAALESDYAPFYAVAGLTSAVASTLQTTWTDTTNKAGERFAAWQSQSEKQAKATADDLTRFVSTLPEQVKALPETTKGWLADWQKQAQEIVRDANSAYADLAGRGKLVVDETLGSARQLGDKAQKRAGDVLSDAADRVDPAFEQVQEGVTRARRSTTGRTATETVTPRSTQKAATTRATARGAAAQKTATRKATAKKAAKKAAATRTAAS
jgi:hypothetical protein